MEIINNKYSPKVIGTQMVERTYYPKFEGIQKGIANSNSNKVIILLIGLSFVTQNQTSSFTNNHFK